MTVTVLYPEGQIPDDKLEREVFGPDVRIVLKSAELQFAAGRGVPHYAGVYQQRGHYVYVHEVSIDKYGQQHALGLCFRSDGTLERAAQGKTVPELSSATGQRAYYAADGTLIQKTPGFNEKDPTVAKNVKDLRYFSVLPPPVGRCCA